MPVSLFAIQVQLMISPGGVALAGVSTGTLKTIPPALL